MATMFCSLIRHPDQVIYPGSYTIVKFPFGSSESWDVHGMHNAIQPDGYEVTDWDNDERSGLIWPSVRGLGTLHATMQWDSANYTEVRHQFVRDPLNLSTGPDTTATEHFEPSIGMQCFTKSWQIIVNPETPLAYRVYHNASGPINLSLAQFKLSINTDLLEQ